MSKVTDKNVVVAAGAVVAAAVAGSFVWKRIRNRKGKK